jgi:hypothetical protein
MIFLRREQKAEQLHEDVTYILALNKGTSRQVHEALLQRASWWRQWAVIWGCEIEHSRFAQQCKREALNEAKACVRDARLRRIFDGI